MRDTLKILYLVDDLDDPRRGTLAHLGRLIGHLDRQHFQPTVAAMHRIDPGFDWNGLPCPVTAIELPQSGSGRVPHALGWDFLSRLRLTRAIRAGHYDIVCAYDLTARLAGLPAARDAGVAVRISCIRDLGHTIGPTQLEALKKANAAATRFVTPSAAGAMRLVRQEKARRDLVDVIPNGIERPPLPDRGAATVAEAKHAFGLSVHERVIFMEAPIVRIKDHATFLAAAAYLAPLHPNARFVCLGLGTPESLARLRNDAARCGVLDRLIPTDDLPARLQWLQAADVAVLTSLSESCSDTLLSYMASGLPIVATSVGGNPELIRHGEEGYLFDPKEADALAMRINIFLLADDLATRLGAAARERVRTEFTVDSEVRRWTDTYRALVYLSAGCGQ